MNLRGKTFLFFLVIFLLATGCAAPLDSPSGQIETPKSTLTVEPTVTTILVPTLTPEPSSMPTPAPTSEPPLKTDGPYLAYFRNIDEQRQLVLMDADGMGRKAIPLPSENDTWTYFVSPDAKWLAYYLGSANDEKDSVLTLNLLDLETGESRLVSSLLSKDYPDNFTEAAKALTDPFFHNAETLKDAFTSGITNSIGWSPDSQYLAFAGQMDGLSSDIYLYNLAKMDIRRVTSGPEEIQAINWSPDGKWILSSSTIGLRAGDGYAEDAIAFGSFAMKHLPLQNLSWGGGWYDGHTYIQHESENGIGDFNYQLVNLETGEVRKIWEGGVHTVVLDREMELAAILAITRTWPQIDLDAHSGMYLVNLRNGEEIYIEEAFLYNIWLLGVGDNRFFATTDYQRQKAYFVSADGTLTPATLGLDNISPAPNQQYWISIAETLKIFDANNALVFDLALPFDAPPSNFGYSYYLRTIWKPDSSGFFIAVNEKIYRFDLPTREFNLIETNLILDKGLTFTSVSKK